MIEGQKYMIENKSGGWAVLLVKECEAKCDVLDSSNPDLTSEKDIWLENKDFQDAKPIKDSDDNKIMTAKEMFEALGFKEQEWTIDQKRHFHYQNTDKCCVRGFVLGVYFEKYFNKDGGYVSTNADIGKDLLKAINKQYQELGWLE